MEKLVGSKTSKKNLFWILLIVFAPTPWGIYHAYNGHGYLQGIISTFFPPYALYMVAESFDGHDVFAEEKVWIVLDFQASDGTVMQMSFSSPHPEIALDNCKRELGSGPTLVTSNLVAAARAKEPLLFGTAKFLNAKCVMSSEFE